jgi:hypothetical protein
VKNVSQYSVPGSNYVIGRMRKIALNFKERRIK